MNNLKEFIKIIDSNILKGIRIIPADYLINSARDDKLNNNEVAYFIELDNDYINANLICNENIDIKIKQKIIDNTIKKEIFK